MAKRLYKFLHQKPDTGVLFSSGSDEESRWSRDVAQARVIQAWQR
ncbi:hypothetical protein [Photorhabdus aballayi]|nr:hypothetical protein [Photorhabdus aballayi]MCW7550011.1 hypothetical protein [Photorhabdus aballayi]